MRRHAKAATAGSNSAWSERPRALRTAMLLASLCVLASAALLAPAASFAVTSHTFLGEFGSASEPSFTEAQTLAVDQSTGDLLVFDSSAGTISRWHSDGTPSEFSALGSNVIDGSETPSGSLEGLSPRESQIAVDNSSGPAAGDIYLTQSGSHVIDVFAEDGHYLGRLSEASGAPFGESCGVGVDGAGNVYVGDFEGVVHKFTPSSSEPPEAWANPANFSMSTPCTLAAGLGATEGSLFVDEYGSGNNVKLDSTSGEAKYTVAKSFNTTVAVDPSSGHVLVVSQKLVSEYDASGATEASALSSFSASATIQGIAVDETSGDVYLSVEGDPHVEVYGPITLPNAVTGEATEVEIESALLNGTVSADGGPEAECEFQYATKAQFQANGFAGATDLPCVPPGPFTGAGATPVSAEATGLTPGTDYVFRVLGRNVNGTNSGQVHAFHTVPVPVIEAQAATAIGTADVTLGAKVNPEGHPTTYHVEYGATNAYGQSTAESAPIGFEGDESPHAVSVHIGGLSPGATYHFRFVATNQTGTGRGSDVAFGTYSTPPSYGPCANGQFRTGFGAALPDCRAYEQATPIDKHGADARDLVGVVEASNAGNRITFFTNGGLPTTGGSSGLAPYMASRGPAGWSSDGLLPLLDSGFRGVVIGWNPDLSRTLVGASSPSGSGLFLRDSDTGAFQPGPEGLSSFDQAHLAGYAADPDHLIFESPDSLLPSVPGSGTKLYDLDHGALSLVGRVPAGGAPSCDDESGPACVVPTAGSVAGAYEWFGPAECSFPGGASCLHYTQAQNAISHDGSRVFFTDIENDQVYVREDGVRTTEVSASQRSTPDPNGEKPAAFMDATPAGSKVLFTSCEKLTDDSTAVSNGEDSCIGEAQGQDLYSYDVESGELTDLTVDSNVSDAKGADVQGVLGASEDGSYVYFAANGVLAPGAAPGNCKINSSPIHTCNLYVSHDGVTTFIAQMRTGVAGGIGGNGEGNNWVPGYRQFTSTTKASRVSADGRTLLFSSTQSLTGYDNIGACSTSGPAPCAELYRYSAPSEELVCVSCNPTGAPPAGPGRLSTGSSQAASDTSLTAILTRNLSADGDRVFFESRDALLPSDTNGVADVYEWEAKGSGSCETESQDGGCIYLISSGTSPNASYFGDASANGDHVFFFTGQQLVPGDKDQLADVYDAAVEGGLASQHELTPPTCSTSACQANPAPPPDPTLGSAVFSGPGNAKKSPAARRCPKGKRAIKSRGKTRCVKAHKKARHHKRHSNRGGQK